MTREGVQAYLVDGVHIRIRKARNGARRRPWFGLAKREPFELPGCEPLDEPGEVWFQFGKTPADLVDALVAEVKATP